jgi:hypothetical protein
VNAIVPNEGKLKVVADKNELRPSLSLRSPEDKAEIGALGARWDEPSPRRRPLRTQVRIGTLENHVHYGGVPRATTSVRPHLALQGVEPHSTAVSGLLLRSYGHFLVTL